MRWIVSNGATLLIAFALVVIMADGNLTGMLMAAMLIVTSLVCIATLIPTPSIPALMVCLCALAAAMQPLLTPFTISLLLGLSWRTHEYYRNVCKQSDHDEHYVHMDYPHENNVITAVRQWVNDPIVRYRVLWASWLISVVFIIRALSLWHAATPLHTIATPLVALELMMIVAVTLLGVLLADTNFRLSHMQSVSDMRRNQLRSLQRRIMLDTDVRSQAIREATLQERTRIARDIHDNVGHLLTRAIMQTQAARAVAQVRADDTQVKQYSDILATVNEAMTMVRKSVHDLRDDGIDWQTRLNDACTLAQEAGMSVHINNTITSINAPAAHCFTLTVREALTNVLRHSNADHVDITARELPAFWQLAIHDNGTKISTRSTSSVPASGIGLVDIEDRARALGGSATSGPMRHGWQVFISLPKPQTVQSSALACDDRSNNACEERQSVRI